ncbi:MAG TPA: right-handed parallel beta-helix repeat-containing protein [Gemmatimonadales bacterium]
MGSPGIRSLLPTAFLLAAAWSQAAAQADVGSTRKPRLWRVPKDLPTVQAAIDSARERDTVLVAPGRYYENLRLRGYNIVLGSEFLLTRDSALIGRTVLDGSRPSHPDSGTVLSIYQFEDSTTVIEGFTITGGTGTVWYDNKDKIMFREGGGILIDLAGPTVRHNVITDNRADETRPGVLSAGGGGVRIGFGDPLLERNVIRRNSGRYGGGVVVFHAAAILRGNVIADNTGGQDFGGAGLWIRGHFSRRLPSLIEDNVITGNVAQGHDGKGQLRRPPAQAGKGGGIIGAALQAVFRRNVVRDNRPNDTEGIPER